MSRSTSGLQGLAPVIGVDARLLIMGSFPSAKSLAAQQYYANPRNQFWPLMGRALDEPLGDLLYRERLARFQSRGVGLWDTIIACDRAGSLDANIRNAEPADIATVRAIAPHLSCIAFNGARAARGSRRWQASGFETMALPSSSPAHTQALAAKLLAWRALTRFLSPR